MVRSARGMAGNKLAWTGGGIARAHPWEEKKELDWAEAVAEVDRLSKRRCGPLTNSYSSSSQQATLTRPIIDTRKY